MRVRHRLLIWLDYQGNPEQAALARYVDEEKVGEHTWTPEPFDKIADVTDAAYRRLDFQQRLW